MFGPGSPKVKQSLGRAALRDPYPTWLLDPSGVIQAANLMAFWLWGALTLAESEEPIEPDALLGASIFDVLAGNLERIPLYQNIEFYVKQAALVKFIDAGQESPPYAAFIAAMKAEPTRARFYEHTLPNPDREWEYLLRIASPGIDELLEFQVTHYRIAGDIGLLVSCVPTAASLPAVESQYSLLMERYGDQPYVLPEAMEDLARSNRSSLPTTFPGFSRAYYPTEVQDPLWYIIRDNRAHQLLTGGSAVGLHFFELFFAPHLREWLGPLQETSAPRAIKYFDTFTLPFRQEDHELHAGYEQVMQRISQVPEFLKVREISSKYPIHLNFPEDTWTPFYTCKVFLPWPLNYDFVMHFRSMVRLIHKGLLVHTEQPYYQLTLVPEEYETDAALILLQLADPGLESAENAPTTLKKWLWGLTIIRTVREGLTLKDEADPDWEPEAAFRRIREELEAQWSTETQEAIEQVMSEIRSNISALDGRIERDVLLSLLKNFADTKPSLSELSAFFARCDILQ